MIDQDKMRALAVELRKYTGTGCVVDDAHAAADAIDLLLAEVEASRKALRQISQIEDKMIGGDWDEIEEARAIANAALSQQTGGSR